MINGISGRLPPIAPPAATPAPIAASARFKPADPDLSTLAAATRYAAAAPPIDSAKVDRIKKAIATGTYKLDPDAVAERMIATDLPPVEPRNG